MRDRKQIREAIECVTAETGGWDVPPTWSQIADVFGALLAPAQAGGEVATYTDEEIKECARAGFNIMSEEAVDFARAVLAKAAEIRARRKPAPEPDARPMLTEWEVGEDAVSTRRFSDTLRTAVTATVNTFTIWARRNEAAMQVMEVHSGAVGPGENARDAADAWIRANPDKAPGRLPVPSHVPGDGRRRPAALRERARGLVEEILRRQVMCTDSAAAVERALRDEREAGIQQGRRDAEGVSLDDDTLGMLVESPFGDEHPIPTTLGAIRALLRDETRADEAATVLREEDEREGAPDFREEAIRVVAAIENKIVSAIREAIRRNPDCDFAHAAAVVEDALSAACQRGQAARDEGPIPMILFCPRCQAQHIDAPDPAIGWTNPPHKSHLCLDCDLVWRPADVPTNGVATIATRGSRDTYEPDERREDARGNRIAHEAHGVTVAVHEGEARAMPPAMLDSIAGAAARYMDATPSPAERAAADRLLDLVGLSSMEEAPIAEIVEWARAFPREEPAPSLVPCAVPEVLATVETGIHGAGGASVSVDRIAIDPARVTPGQRVTVAVLTGDVAGIVEAHKRREEFAEHMTACEAGCSFDRNGNPRAFEICADGERLAAVVKPIK